jgi:hypothetical protein
MPYIDEIIRNIPNGLYYLAIAYAVWFIARFYFIRFCNVEKQISTHDADVSLIKSDISKINILLSKIVSYICTKDNRINPGMFSSNSPLSINAKGMEILINSGGKEFVDTNLDYLLTKISDQHPYP